MGWPVAFRDQLGSGTVQPFYVLESVAVPDGIAGAFGGELRLSSFPLAGYQNILTLEGSSISYGELRVRTWVASQMTWSVGLVGDLAGGAVRADTRRGQTVILRVGFSRDLSTFETVAAGTVYNVERRGGRWSIVIRDLAGALVTRLTDDPTKAELFFDLASTLVATAYTPGDAELHVGDTTGFRTDGGSVGAIRVTPTTGDDFFLTFTGIVLGPGPGLPKFTGLSSTGGFDTTALAAIGGRAVTEVAYIVDSPIAIIRKILVSTGNGTNGPFDVLPESWGYGIPEVLVAVDDMTSYIGEINVTGSDAQEFVEPERIVNAKARLDTFLNPAGYFLSQHQGQITCRAVLRPDEERSPAHFSITHRDIAAIEQYQAFDRASPVEYLASIVVTGGDVEFETASVFVEALPVQAEILHALSGLFSDNVNLTNIRDGHAERLARWDLKTPERMVLRLIGFEGARVSLGDTIDLTTSLLVDREGRVYNQREGLVIQAGSDWFRGTSRVVILFLPTLLVAQPLP